MSKTMRLIDADAAYETLCHLWDRSDGEEFEKGVFNTILYAPTIKTKQIKYYDDDENVWKIGEVIVDE